MNMLRIVFALLALLSLVLTGYLSAVLVPATYWYEPRELLVVGVTESGDPQVTLEREIHRSFAGSYVVEVRWAEDRTKPSAPGMVESGSLACYGSDQTNYKGGLISPYTSTLMDFSGRSPGCNLLPDGVFYVNACWTVMRPFLGLVPAKEVCITSNPFRVGEAP